MKTNYEQIITIFQSALTGKANAEKDRDCPLVPAFFSTRPKSILVANKPLVQGGEIRAISTEQFEAQYAMTWSKSPLIHELRKTKIYDDEQCSIGHLNILFEHLYFQDPKMVICDINEQVGKGVFANQAFSKFSVITIYSGVVDSSFEGKTELKEYGYLCNDPDHLQSMFAKHYGNPMYNAQTVRNYSSYFQHAPDNDTLKKLAIPEELKKGIITANVAIFPGKHLGFPVLIIMALRDIKLGEQLAFDYGTYWESQVTHQQGDGSYCLFDQQARIVGRAKGSEFTVDSEYNIDHMSEAPRSSCSGYDMQMMLAFQERKCIQNINKYLIKNLEAALANVPVALKNEHGNFFRAFDKSLKTKKGLDLYNDFVGIMAGGIMESIPELILHVRVIYALLNRFVADLKAVHENKKPFLPGHLAAKSDLLLFLNAKTGETWKYSSKQDCFFTSGTSEQMTTVKSWFDDANISKKQFGASAQGVTFLSYLAKDITLQSLANLQTCYQPPSSILKI